MKLVKKVKTKVQEMREIFEISRKNNEQIGALIDEVNELKKKVDNAAVNFNYIEKKINILDLLPKMLGQRSAIANGQSRKKKVLVAGFFGAFNLGDELILESLLVNLDRTSYEVTIMLCDNFHSDITRYGGYQFVHYPSTIFELNDLAYLYDAVIFPGGAIIDDCGYGLENERLTMGTILLTLSKRFIAFHKTCILYGLSTNEEIKNPDFIDDLSFVVNYSNYFSLRDENSLRTLVKAGIDTKKIKIVDDAVFGHPIWSKAIQTKEKDEIGLIYIFSEETLPSLAKFTKKILEIINKKTKLKIIPFYDYKNNDVSLAKKLIEVVGDARLSLEYQKLGDMKYTIDAIDGKIAIISMRYHGTLLANMLGKNVICINYDKHRHYKNKNSYIYSHYNFTKKYLNYSKLDSYDTQEIKNLIYKKVEKKSISKAAEITKQFLGNLVF